MTATVQFPSPVPTPSPSSIAIPLQQHQDEASTSRSQRGWSPAMPAAPSLESEHGAPLDSTLAAAASSSARPLVPSRSSSIRSSTRSSPRAPLQDLPLESPTEGKAPEATPPPSSSSSIASSSEADASIKLSSPPSTSRPRPRPHSLSLIRSTAPSMSHPQDQLFTASAQPRRSPPRRGTALCSLQQAAASVAASESGGSSSAYSTSFSTSATTLPSLSSSKSLSRATTISSPSRHYGAKQHRAGFPSSPSSPPSADVYVRKRTQSTNLAELRRNQILPEEPAARYTSLQEAAAAAAAETGAKSGAGLSAGSPPSLSWSHSRPKARRGSSTTVAGLPSADSKLVRSKTIAGGMPLSLSQQANANAAASEQQVSSSTLSPSTAALPSARALSGLEAKVVILGAQGVGKTSIVHRYTAGTFSSTSSVPSTIGASFLTKKLVISGTKCRLQIWDTAGQERFRSMAPMYYRNAHAAVIVYDVTSRESFMDVRTWIEELRRNVGLGGMEGLILHIVGAKVDLASRAREVDMEEAREQLLRWLVPERQRVIDAREEEREQQALLAAASSNGSGGAGGGFPTSATMSRLSSLSSLAMGSAASKLAVAFPSVTGSGTPVAGQGSSTPSLPIIKRPPFSRYPTAGSAVATADASSSSIALPASAGGAGSGSAKAGSSAGSTGEAPGAPLGPTPSSAPLSGTSPSSPPLGQSSSAFQQYGRLPGDDYDLLLTEVSSKDDSPSALAVIEEVFVAVTERLVERKGEEMMRQSEMRRRESIFLGAQDGEEDQDQILGGAGGRSGFLNAGGAAAKYNGWSCC